VSEFAHQSRSLAFLADKAECFDMSEPGTGKTYVHLKSFARRHAASRKSGLVLATKSLLEAAWAEDARKFTPEIRVSVAWAKNRQEAFERDADLYVTNHDAVKDLLDQGSAFFKRFGHLIIDESTAYKHYTSQRSRAAAKIRRYFETCDLLSGTPTPNGVLDMWHQAYILDHGKRLGPLYNQFRQAVCEPKEIVIRGRQEQSDTSWYDDFIAEYSGTVAPSGLSGWSPGAQKTIIKWEAKDGANEAVAARMADVSLRHLLEDCVDMPQKIVRVVPFALRPKHRAIYDAMARDLVANVNEHTVLAVNRGVLRTKLLQIASGSVYGEDTPQLIASDRYDLVLDLVEEAPNSIVVFLWKHQRDELIAQAKARNLSYAVIDGDVSDTRRQEIVRAYQDGFFRVLFGHPKSMAHGLTLTRGVRTIWASPTVDLEWWEQANRRIYRIGQTQRTETIVVCAEGTQDEIEFRRCNDKDLDAKSLYSEINRYHQ
jgi:SNF2-related domain